MKIIEVRPSKKFKGAWVVFEDPGVQPAFQTPNAKADALSYARNRFTGCPRGEVHAYDDAGEQIVEKILIDGGDKYGNRSDVSGPA
jgi:hypothetical protein